MSGVLPSDPVVLHRYQPGSGGVQGSTLCGGRWYKTGEAPCEVAEQTMARSLDELPPCEASDEDIAAAAALLGLPRASRCWTRDCESWENIEANMDPKLDPEKVQGVLTSLQSGIISKAEAFKRAFGA